MLTKLSKLFKKVRKLSAVMDTGRDGAVGASYSVWDGEELLEYAIRSIRAEVDHVNVVWQRLSWYGNPCAPTLEKDLKRLVEIGLVDELVYFEPDLNLSPNINETNKRNLGLETARSAGCSYLLTLDADEFFVASEFRDAVNHVKSNGITHSACNQFGYHDICLRKSLPESWFAPFLYRIDNGEQFVINAFGVTPWLLDPSKKIPIGSRSKSCFLGMVRMHHFSEVRRNLDRKLKNSSACQTDAALDNMRRHYEETRKKISDGIEEGDFVKVDNVFGIRI